MNEFIICSLDVPSNVCRDVALSRRRGVLVVRTDKQESELGVRLLAWSGKPNLLSIAYLSLFVGTHSAWSRMSHCLP